MENKNESMSNDMISIYQILDNNFELNDNVNTTSKEELLLLAKAINLEVNIDDFYVQFLKTCDAVDNLKGYKDAGLLKYYLEEMKIFLDLLKKGSQKYNRSIINDNITEEKIDVEKKKYLSKRYLNNLDIY